MLKFVNYLFSNDIRDYITHVVLKPSRLHYYIYFQGSPVLELEAL
jgi:hypothetical protein